MDLAALQTNITYEAALGAALVISGVVMKNTAEKLNQPDSILGMALFVIGWALFANAVARNSANAGATVLPYIAAAVVIVSVMLMKRAMKAGSSPAPFVVGFVVGWLLFAWSLTQNRGMAFASAILVFIAMLWLLPKQRAMCLVDGAGMPLFVAAWVGLIIANSNLMSQPIG